jgi:hypothetical protein
MDRCRCTFFHPSANCCHTLVSCDTTVSGTKMSPDALQANKGNSSSQCFYSDLENGDCFHTVTQKRLSVTQKTGTAFTQWLRKDSTWLRKRGLLSHSDSDNVDCFHKVTQRMGTFQELKEGSFLLQAQDCIVQWLTYNRWGQSSSKIRSDALESIRICGWNKSVGKSARTWPPCIGLHHLPKQASAQTLEKLERAWRKRHSSAA